VTALPRLLVVTDRGQAAAAGHDLVDVVAAAVDAGAQAVLLREKDLPLLERLELAARLTDLGALVLLAIDEPPIRPVVHAAGFHLSAMARGNRSRSTKDEEIGPGPRDLFPHPPATGTYFLGQSCHSTDELLVAAADRVDYATLSPIWATASKPGYGPALGIEGLAKAVVAVPELPVYALGGVMPGRATPCIEAGAAGVAVMGAVMGAPDPAAVVRVLLAELGETGRR
jgi:thiamine-phosphate pyrophosphorylase